ncbi:hypothetical protein DY000_02054386 [Brassica cretica]|uniref:Uncharacterized protein n=1 Tax=Brassica cretica TaxID=69181 RepID=A0ABQ7A6P7_BRACR|nr:hypothetical protein DY000_02054386 [Brassica cretica]
MTVKVTGHQREKVGQLSQIYSSGFTIKGSVHLVLVLLCKNLVVVLVVVCRSLLPQMPPASPIEDRGTAIPIEDRDRAISEHLLLCGVIVKGLPIGNPGSLSETSSLTPHILLQVTSREDRSTRGTVGAGVD